VPPSKEREETGRDGKRREGSGVGARKEGKKEEKP
jgi:hypothetical protein